MSDALVPAAQALAAVHRVRVEVVGRVQGIGFRPLACNLARELGLAGWVRNAPSGARIEAQGVPEVVERFLAKLRERVGARAEIERWVKSAVPAVAERGFEIRESVEGTSTTPLPLDRATCEACRAEVFETTGRRWRYPFTTCNACGPRYAILRRLPYDRANTTMAAFTPCDACADEVADPGDRRFHHQANACPACGPTLELREPSGKVVARGDGALAGAAGAIRCGAVVALKGLGGYQLIVDARSDEAVEELRRRKGREAKPLAVMAPSLDWALAHCEVDGVEEATLTGPAAPIVLLRRRDPRSDAVAAAVAPDNPNLGVFLPTTPLHHLLLDDLAFPVVATSANLAGDPIVYEDADALEYLRDVADLFLVHDRAIARPVDDSVARGMDGAATVLRAARGYAPVVVERGVSLPPAVAVGGHLKGAVAAAIGSAVHLMPHIGDLDGPRAAAAHARSVRSLARDYGLEVAPWVTDLHPDYRSTRFAEAAGGRSLGVQHHHAHALAAAADAGLRPPLLAVAWDGTGWGADGTVWGGEFLRVDTGGWRRAAHLAPFRLPGGETAVREGRRSAVGALHELLGAKWVEREDLPPVAAFGAEERAVLAQAMMRGLGAPWTTSAGRLFDAVSALAGLRQRSAFEGEAAMALEFAADAASEVEGYPIEIREGAGAGAAVLDWRSLLEGVLVDLATDAGPSRIAARFHASLVDAIVAVARLVGERRVVLSGGCFQNKRLLEGAAGRLRAEGFDVGTHRRVPPNDGSLALGQALAAVRELGS